MARIVFTPQLQRFTSTPEVQTSAASLRAALGDVISHNPPLRGVVLATTGTCGPTW